MNLERSPRHYNEDGSETFTDPELDTQKTKQELLSEESLKEIDPEVTFQQAQFLAQDGRVAKLESQLEFFIKNDVLTKKEAKILLVECYTYKITTLLRLAETITHQKTTFSGEPDIINDGNDGYGDFNDSHRQESSPIPESAKTLLAHAEILDEKRDLVIASMDEISAEKFKKMLEDPNLKTPFLK